MGRFKCNTDGTSKGNPELGSKTSCVQDEEGNLIFAEARKEEICTAIVADVKAFRARSKYCLENGLLPLFMETNSLIVKKVLDGVWEA
ncbi:hypothetical protein H5410_051431, partial [Solanum commersonii]